MKIQRVTKGREVSIEVFAEIWENKVVSMEWNIIILSEHFPEYLCINLILLKKKFNGI